MPGSIKYCSEDVISRFKDVPEMAPYLEDFSGLRKHTAENTDLYLFDQIYRLLRENEKLKEDLKHQVEYAESLAAKLAQRFT